MGLLTLLTDFGDRDSYVGVMKGVILGIAPETTIVDLTHGIAPQDIAAGRFQLQSAYGYFPGGTVHMAVVDPGVGSERRSIAFATEQAFFVGPDNGLLTGVQEPIVAAVHLDRPQYWRCAEPSSTFQGRDIFAPVAAHLCKGVPIANLGTSIDPESLVRLALPLMTNLEGNQITGCIQSVDHFGNLITNLKLEPNSSKTWQIHLENNWFLIQQTYAESPVGAVMAIVGSHGFVEIAVNCGNAQERLGLKVGDRIVMNAK